MPWAEDPDHEEGSSGYKGNGKRKKKKVRNKFIALLVLAAIVAVVCFFFDDLKRLVFPSSETENVEYIAQKDPTLGIEMVYVEGGTFMMGDEDDDEAGSDKLPHRVSLDSYYIGKYEVTVGLWKTVMGYVPEACSSLDRYPVSGISWEEAQDFVNELNVMTGKNYRLPTEAEWEYAARGGNRSRGYVFSGSDNLDAVAWYEDNSGGCTHTVGTKSPNELGLYDMTGNVIEWTQDHYGSYSADAQVDPMVTSGSGRVIKGGSWASVEKGSHLSFRYDESPGNKDGSQGFRLAL